MGKSMKAIAKPTRLKPTIIEVVLRFQDSNLVPAMRQPIYENVIPIKIIPLLFIYL